MAFGARKQGGEAAAGGGTRLGGLHDLPKRQA